MRALVLDPDRTARHGPQVLADHPEPRRSAGEALVRMRVAGVCDTDLQLARGYMSYAGVLGHEFVGEVLEADDSAWVGCRVVADINAGCGKCRDCTERDGHHCQERSVLGILKRDGAFAERLVVPQRNLVRVPDGVPDDAAVFAEPLAAALHVLDEAIAGRSAVVIGDGKLGQLILRALHGSGVRVTLVGHHQDKLDLARAIGAEAFLEAELPKDLRVPLVVEASGSKTGLERAFSLLEPRGTVVLKTTVADRIELDFATVVINELRIVGSRCGDMQRAIEMLDSDRLDPTPLIQARYDLLNADEALRRAGRPGTLKVLVDNPS